jgi:hypothetical protein
MTPAQNKVLVRRLLEAIRRDWTPAVIEEFFAVSFFAIVRIENDKVVEEWGGLDVADVLSQPGAL